MRVCVVCRYWKKQKLWSMHVFMYNTISLFAGDYPYAEMDAIRARKAQERAQRFGVDGQHPLHQQQRQVPAGPQMTFDPNLGFSNGGLMETRIGAVGDSRARDHIPPEASAQMY